MRQATGDGEVVRRGEVYSRPEFIRRAGIGRNGWYSLLRQGLPISRVGKRVFISGDTWFDFVSGKQAVSGSRQVLPAG